MHAKIEMGSFRHKRSLEHGAWGFYMQPHPVEYQNALVAQLAVRMILNLEAPGSKPGGGTIRCGPVVKTFGFHPKNRGSTPRSGK